MGNFDELDETLDGYIDEPEATEADGLDDYEGLDELPEDDDLTEDERAELEAVAAADAEMHDALEDALVEAQRDLEAQREATRAAVARYREALLAAEPDLPPDLVAGDTLEDLDASARAARQAVAQIRERLASEARAEASRGFPIGAPAREPRSAHAMSSAEKIAAGLSERRE